MESCKMLALVLQSENCPLKVLDLSNNDLQNSEVEQLSVGPKAPQCKLEILRLSGCMVTVEGCSSLASALCSNPSHLKELDLTYNHPGESGLKLLSARLKDRQCSLSILRMDHSEKLRIRQGLKKYCCEFTLDPNTAHSELSLSNRNRKVTNVRYTRWYPHPERFDHWEQVLCRENVTGRCYWEAEWSGREAEIAVAYKTINRKGDNDDCMFGRNEKSWSLNCSDNSYYVYHNNNRTEISAPSTSSKRVGVYVDYPSGTLSFYSVSSDTYSLTHLHTFNITLFESLYAGFRLYYTGSSLCVCEI